MAIITRPNIIFAILKLLHFFTNPSPMYIQIINKIINYLLGIYTLKLKFGGGDKLKIVTDTFFTDNICNGIHPEVTCRVTCGVRIERLGPDQGLAKGRVSLELHE